MVGTASCAEDDYRFDPAKRIPLLTEKNWADWSWRVAAAFSVITGSAANFLFHRHSSADVGSAGVSEDVKKLKKKLTGLKMRLNLCGGDDAAGKKELQEEIR